MKNNIHYVDVGARGDLGQPWASHESELTVYGFEADPIEHDRLQSQYPLRRYFPFALSSSSGNIRLFLTREPSQSSIYPPSLHNQQFERKHWVTRKVLEEVLVPCTSLDEALIGFPIDAIKIDTQGAEYEILKGGSKLMVSQRPILFLETWCHSVYSGAPLMHDILKYLYSLGYELWATEPAAAWRHDVHEEKLPMQNTRQRLIGLNLLLVPQLELLKKLPSERIQAKINILRWYGFLDAAYLLALEIGNEELLHNIKKEIARSGSLWFRIFSKIVNLMKGRSASPPIT